MFLILEYENGDQAQEQLDVLSLDEAKSIAVDALEDAPITYLYDSYTDDIYGLQPATHLDYIEKFERETFQRTRKEQDHG